MYTATKRKNRFPLVYRLSESIENNSPKKGDKTAAIPLSNAGSNKYRCVFRNLLSNMQSRITGMNGVNANPTTLLIRFKLRHADPPSFATIVPTSARMTIMVRRIPQQKGLLRLLIRILLPHINRDKMTSAMMLIAEVTIALIIRQIPFAHAISWLSKTLYVYSCFSSNSIGECYLKHQKTNSPCRTITSDNQSYQQCNPS